MEPRPATRPSDNDPPSKEAVERLLAEMTVEEKIGQMTQVSHESISPAEVADLSIGSVLSGGDGNPSPNTPSAWADMVGGLKEGAAGSRLGIPLLYGIDAVHGHSNVRGATIFPHNIGLGSAGDPNLVRRIGRATAIEMLATGVDWTFAPTVAVPQDIRWGRTYEGFGRDPDLVSSLGAALVEGLQEEDANHGGVVACAKHFVADGATKWGTAPRVEWNEWWNGWGNEWQIDQGDAPITEEELRAIHLRPFVAAVEAGVLSVMASYSSWNGTKVHGHRQLLTDLLKHELGFGGFVISDWMGVDQIHPDYGQAVITAINAGIDMVMVPYDFKRFLEVMSQAVSDGRIPIARIDDAVRRILRTKLAAGLFPPGPVPPLEMLGSSEHRSLAEEAVRKSAVLLKNDNTLPITNGVAKVAVAGIAADDIGLQCGGWTVGWQGGTGRTTDGATLLDGMTATGLGGVFYQPNAVFGDDDKFDVGVVCIAEPPYAEGPGDNASPTATDHDREVFSRMRERADRIVLVVYSGRPLVIPDLIAQADAVVAAWLPGSEASALAALLSGRHPFTGRTSQPWPRSESSLEDVPSNPLYPVGHGLGSGSAQ